MLTHPLFGNIRSPNGNFSQNTQSICQEYGSLFCLSGGYIAAIKLYRWCNLHAGNTTGSWRLACRAVMADEWIYADFRQFFVVSRCCCGCYWQKAHFYRRLSPVLPEQRYVCLTQDIFMAGLFRSLQGLAGALILASGSAALARLYEGTDRTRAFSILGTMFGVGLAFGPVLMGFITDALGWRWLYAMLALLSGIVILTGAAFLPASEESGHQKPDGTGLIIFTAALMLFTSAVMLIPAFGFLSFPTLALFISAMLLFSGFVVRCLEVENPVLDISLLLRPRFAGVLLLPIATCYCYVVLLIIIPLHFMGGDGMSESRSAFYLMALTSPMLVFPYIAALLTRWFSPGTVSAAGLIIASVGLLFLGYALPGNSSNFLVLSLIMTGTGAALPWGLMDGLALSAVSVEKAGMAAGLFNTVRVAGEGIALAMASAFLTEMNDLNLKNTVHGYAPEVIHQAAAWLGGGSTEQAAAMLPGISRLLLQDSYDTAYTFLFRVLAAVTLICALMVWITLGRQRQGCAAGNTLARDV